MELNFTTIAEIYAANDHARERLKNTVSNLSDEQVYFVPGGEGWSVAHIVEHLSKVERGMTGISSKLLSKAEDRGRNSDGTANLSPNFIEKLSDIEGKKFEAPDVVKPEGSQSVSQSMTLLDESQKNLDDMQRRFDTVEGTEFTFPHPYFGGMTAQDWLALIGGHESRHLDQIDRILTLQNDATD